MAKQIKRSDVSEKDLYRDIRKSAEDTIGTVESLNKELGETAEVLLKKLKKPLDVTAEGLKEVTENPDKLNEIMKQSLKLDKAKADAIKAKSQADKALSKLQKEKIKQDKEKLKLSRQLEQATDEEVKAKIRYQKATREQKKILADELILLDKSAGTLEKLAASNRILRREREKLDLSTVDGRKRLKEINDELDENNEQIKENSDALKKQKLNVGNYTESIQEATGELGGLIGGIKKSVDALKTQVQSFRQQAKAANTAGKKVKAFGKALKGIGIGLVIALLGALVNSFAGTRKGVLAMEGTMKKFAAITKRIGSQVGDFISKIMLKIEKFGLSIEGFKSKINNLGGTYFGVEVKPFEGLFEDIRSPEEIEKDLKRINKELENIENKKYPPIGGVLDGVDETIKKTFEYENALANTTEQIEKLRGEEEVLSERAGDMTLSFDQQRAAQEKLNETVIERIKLEKDLAKQNVDLQALKIREQLITAGQNYSIEQIKNLEFLKNEEAQLKISSEALAELRDAKTELISKDNELNSTLSKNAMEQRNTDKDDFEKKLDYAIDAFDVVKTINERIINNEKTTLAEREILTEETRRLADKSFKNQIGLVEDYTKQKIDFEKLIQLQDEEAIRAELKKSILNETTLTRILEIIKERKLALQDLSETEQETGDKRLEMNRRILESEQAIQQDNYDLEIELMERNFDKAKELGEETIDELRQRLDAQKKIMEERLMDQAEFDIQQAEEEILDDEEKAQKIKEIEEKLANDIERINLGITDKKKELDEKEIESEEEKAAKLKDKQAQRLEDALAVQQQLTDAFVELTDRRIAKIDEEIAASERRFSTLQDLAAEGNITAKESLAEEARLLAEQNRKKEQLERRKQRIELASSVLEAYQRNTADESVTNPLAKTITDTVLLTEFIKSLPAFYEGTEDTGKHGEGVDGKGGFFSILHPNERVMPKEFNAMTGNMSNEDLATLAYKYQSGLITDTSDFKGGMAITDNSLVIKELQDLKRTIKNKPETNIELEQIISGAMVVKRTTSQGNTKVYNRYRV